MVDSGCSLRSRSRRNIHRWQSAEHDISERKRRITGTGGKDKTAVFGALERGGKLEPL